jgi:hypothetical protein
MKIEISIRVTDRADAYTTLDVAAAKIETMAPWDEIKPTAYHRALDSALEDVLARVEKQLKAEHDKRRADERERAVNDSDA